MYQTGDCVVKMNAGLCRVTDILHLDGRNVDKNKLYYLLVPFSDEKMKIYVPVDQHPDTLRRAMSSEEAWEIINGIPQIEEVSIENEKLREKEYKEAIKSCQPKMLISVIKTMYGRKKMRSAQGKKSTAMDERYFRLAEEYLYEELAYAIGREPEEMGRIIAEAVEKNS